MTEITNNRYYKSSGLKINIRNYIIFTLFSTPFIDLINGLIGETVRFGQMARSAILVLNVLLCVKHIPKEKKKWNNLFIMAVTYAIIQAFLSGIISSGNFISNLVFDTKYLLFLSEAILIINNLELGRISKKDIDRFWKFSCWFVPVSLIVAKYVNIGNFAGDKAGLYASSNAVTFIFIIQFLLSIYYARESKICWISTFLNIVGIFLIRTKSPYLYVAAIVAFLIVFYSKHRIRTIIIVAASIIVGYYIYSNYFESILDVFMQYQTYHLKTALQNGKIWDYLFSGRNVMLMKCWNGLGSFSNKLFALLFGVGIEAFPSSIEMDFFEILLSSGFFVTLVIYLFIFKSFKWNSNDKIEKMFLNLAIIVFISYSTLGGHTLLEGIASMYSAILIGLKYSSKNRCEVAKK